ncbi:hypothetical protein AURDEDRAFT_123057 [Auricularia subglabra TFB-10046 SS5]|nr:hypothetical protein AURDEDRAFT_123057 [Auricularia subglabra TFB-10046 SS5]
MGWLRKHAQERTASLLTDAGFMSFLATREQRAALVYGRSRIIEDHLGEAIDDFVYHPVRRMHRWNAVRRQRELEVIFGDLSRDIGSYLRGRQLAAWARLRHSAALSPPPPATSTFFASASAPQPAQGYEASGLAHDGSPSSHDAYASFGTSGHVMPPDEHAASPSAQFPTDAYEPPQSSFSDTDLWMIFSHCDELSRMRTVSNFCAFATNPEDPRCRIAAGQFVDLDFRGNQGSRPEHLPTVKMLHDVAPQIASLQIDIPFRPSKSEAPSFPSLQYLYLDVENEGLWTLERTLATVAGLRANFIPNVRFDNARSDDVCLCSELVPIPEKLILVHRLETRYLVFIDQRGYRRYVSGEFVNAIPRMFDEQYLSSITDLTLNELMPEQELALLYKSFPRGVQNLRIWFGEFPSSNGVQAGVLNRLRDDNKGCCAALRELTLTAAAPVNEIEEGERLFNPSVFKWVLDAFLQHVCGPELSKKVRVVWSGVDLQYDH